MGASGHKGPAGAKGRQGEEGLYGPRVLKGARVWKSERWHILYQLGLEETPIKSLPLTFQGPNGAPGFLGNNSSPESKATCDKQNTGVFILHT